MRLTTRSRFALTAMVDVALHCGDGPVALSAISERHGISLSYLEILFSALRFDCTSRVGSVAVVIHNFNSALESICLALMPVAFISAASSAGSAG